jgi:uncharacterized membrane protein HdeD (DUF308 family)
LLRGLFAFGLGFSLLFIPEKTHNTLYNFMGMFWLMSGFVLVRQEIHLKRGRIFMILGIAGVVTGLLVLTRPLTNEWFGGYLMTSLLGAIVLLTGIIHMVGGFQIGNLEKLGRGRTWVSTSLGVFEVILGGLVLWSHTGTSQLVYIVAMIWALLGGTFLFIDAFRQRRQMKASS